MTSPLLTQFHAMFIIVIKELVVFAARGTLWPHCVFAPLLSAHPGLFVQPKWYPESYQPSIVISSTVRIRTWYPLRIIPAFHYDSSTVQTGHCTSCPLKLDPQLQVIPEINTTFSSRFDQKRTSNEFIRQKVSKPQVFVSTIHLKYIPWHDTLE